MSLVGMRESWIDSWKGLLIFLVVVGHVVGMMCHYAAGETSRFMSLCYKWIYLFHMPAFFVVVGYVRRGGERSDFRGVVVKGARRLLVPYFFWGLVSVGVLLAMMSVMVSLKSGNGYYSERMAPGEWWQPLVSLLHAGGWPNGNGFRCNSVLWFLPVMFLTLLARYGLQGVGWLRDRTLNKFFLIAVCLVIGGALRLYVGALPWGIDRVPRFLAFVYFGDLLAGIGVKFGGDACHLHLQPSSNQRPKHLPLFRAATAFVACGVALTWGAVTMPDLVMAFYSWRWYFAEAGLAALGSVMTLALARCVDCRLLAVLGMASLGIMVIHKFPIVALQSLGTLQRVMNGLGNVTALGVALCIAIGVTAIAWGVTWCVRRVMPWAVGEK